MKAIATLAVLGLAFASETKQNPRFRVDRKVITAHNNNDVLNVDFNKDFNNVQGVKTTVTTQDLKDLIPAGLRDYVKNVKVEEKVFQARNNNGVININMDDEFMVVPKPINRRGPIPTAHSSNWGPSIDLSQINGSDDELFLNVNHQSTKVNANHNSGMMNIGIGRDDADNELRTTVNANDNHGMMMVRGHDDELAFIAPEFARGGKYYHLMNDDELFLDLHHQNTHVNANHNSGRANINIHNDDELMMIPRWRDHREHPDLINIASADDELFLDFTHKNTKVNANHNSGMMNIGISHDDELMMVPRWRDRREHPDLINVVAADDELFLDFTHKNTNVNANHNRGMMNIGISHDDADNELASASWKTDDLYNFPSKKGGLDYVHIKTDNQVNEYHGNKGVTIISRDDADDEFFLNFNHKSSNVNANHNRGMMNINIQHDDADNELARLVDLLRSQ